MSSYTTLAEYYDEFTEDVNYSAWTDYLLSLFKKHGDGAIHDVLDLACGTGSLSLLLAEQGFEVIGTDMSEDMLSEAQNKAYSLKRGIPPLFLCQSMEELDLYGTVDATVCCLDSINYLSSLDALKASMLRLRFFIRPGGLLIFDVNTNAKFEALDGRVFLRENDAAFCTWSAEYDRATRLCSFCYDIFSRCEDNLWERDQEIHVERAHSHEEILSALEAADFVLEATYGELSDTSPQKDEQRIFYVAKKK